MDVSLTSSTSQRYPHILVVSLGLACRTEAQISSVSTCKIRHSLGQFAAMLTGVHHHGQVGGAKVTDAKEIDRLQESLEKIVGTSSRSLQRTASKRPLVGDVKQSGNKSLLYNLMGGPQFSVLPYHMPCHILVPYRPLCSFMEGSLILSTLYSDLISHLSRLQHFVQVCQAPRVHSHDHMRAAQSHELDRAICHWLHSIARELRSDSIALHADEYKKSDVLSVEESIVNHVEYTLARSRYSCDDQEAYQAASLSLRDRLIESWNDTQQYFK